MLAEPAVGRSVVVYSRLVAIGTELGSIDCALVQAMEAARVAADIHVHSIVKYQDCTCSTKQQC